MNVDVGVVDERRERLSWLVVAAFALVAAFVPVGAFIAWFLLPIAVVKLVFYRFEIATSTPTFERGEMQSLADGILLRTEKHELRCTRDVVSDGWSEPWPEPAVVLRIPGKRVYVRSEQANAILDACGRTAATNVTRMRILPVTARFPLAGTVAMFSAIAATPVVMFVLLSFAFHFANTRLLDRVPGLVDLGLLVVALLVLLVAALVTRPRLVEIGRDQLVVHGPFGARRVPIAEIERIERTPQGLRIDTARGSLPLDVAAWHLSIAPTSERRRLQEALFARIAASCKVEAAAPPAARLRILEQGTRSIDEYRALLARVAGGEDYRSETLTPPELVAVVSAREVSRPLRVAAAYALSTTADAGAVGRATDAACSIVDEAEREETLAALRGTFRA